MKWDTSKQMEGANYKSTRQSGGKLSAEPEEGKGGVKQFLTGIQEKPRSNTRFVK